MLFAFLVQKKVSLYFRFHLDLIYLIATKTQIMKASIIQTEVTIKVATEAKQITMMLTKNSVKENKNY